MIPGFSNLMGGGREQESVARIKRFLCIMDSMTPQGATPQRARETRPVATARPQSLTATTRFSTCSRQEVRRGACRSLVLLCGLTPVFRVRAVQRIARGSGRSVRDVHEVRSALSSFFAACMPWLTHVQVLETFKPFKKVASKLKDIGGPKGARAAPRRAVAIRAPVNALVCAGNMDPKKMMGPQGMRNLQQMFNPKMIAQLGGERRPLATSPRAPPLTSAGGRACVRPRAGMQNLQKMMKQFGAAGMPGGGGMPGFPPGFMDG